MDEDIVLMIVASLTTISGIGALLFGWISWLRYRAQRLSGGAQGELEKVRRAVADLRTEMEHLYGELSANQQELHERIDFAERLLSRGRSPER